MSVCKLFDLVEGSVKMRVERSLGRRHKDTTRTPRPPTPGRAQLGPSATQALSSHEAAHDSFLPIQRGTPASTPRTEPGKAHTRVLRRQGFYVSWRLGHMPGHWVAGLTVGRGVCALRGGLSRTLDAQAGWLQLRPCWPGIVSIGSHKDPTGGGHPLSYPFCRSVIGLRGSHPVLPPDSARH